eukprot:390431_1
MFLLKTHNKTMESEFDITVSFWCVCFPWQNHDVNHCLSPKNIMPHTTTHPFIGWTILHVVFKANLHSSAVWWTILVGSMTPDFFYLFWYLYYKIQGHSENKIFNHDINNKIWSNIIDYSHSITVSSFIAITTYIIYCIFTMKISNTHSKKDTTNNLTLNSVELHTMSNVMSSNIDINEISLDCDENKEHKNTDTGHKLYILQEDNNNDNTEDRMISTIQHSSITHGKTCRNCWCHLQTFSLLLSYFWIAISLHCIIDFPLHSQDARAQLVPITKYIFHSPISYWNYDYYGYISAPVLSLIVQIGTIWMYTHKKHDWIQQNKYVFWFMVILLFVNVSIESITMVKAFIHIIKLISQ